MINLKTGLIILVSAVALTLAACGKKQEAQEQEAPATSASASEADFFLNAVLILASNSSISNGFVTWLNATRTNAETNSVISAIKSYSIL